MKYSLVFTTYTVSAIRKLITAFRETGLATEDGSFFAEICPNCGTFVVSNNQYPRCPTTQCCMNLQLKAFPCSTDLETIHATLRSKFTGDWV